MKIIIYRLGNLELREVSRASNLLEIIRWNEETCFTIACWSRNKDGHYELHFIGGRPFDSSVSWDDFGQLARVGQDYIEQNISD